MTESKAAGIYDPIGPWSRSPLDPQPALVGDLKADVAIVGGGYLGLSAALRLRRAGCEVALLEQSFCGAGASGRNAGHLTPTIGKDVYTCLRQWGVERGLALAAFAEAAVDATEARIAALNIDCDYVGNGNIVAGLHPAHRKPLEAAAAAMSAAGLPTSFLEDRDLRARGLPRAFRFGLLERRGGHLNPGKYARGLRFAALAAGVKIFEHTAVTGVREGPQPRLRTAMGHVSAKQVLIATNAYVQPDLAGAAGRILPLRVTLFQTEPLSSMQRQGLGWPGGEGVYTAHEIMESYRITPEGRLVGGSK
ncbi:FAD-dependent oxidoreductase [Phenylobacterium sp. 20VBR1]|uniref:FAD-dependent oxidoreductase n=1 Tax=Phenylobacterium glaciei TaxID=2803784 RepID=A0A941D267_9CAUL|nr:FAD-dependent oxidoreductase [Phenylobacterium glaciei]